LNLSQAADALRASFLFSNIGKDAALKLAQSAEELRFGPGDFIFWEGDPPIRFYMLTSGRIKVIKHGSQGRETLVAVFNPGDIFGEVAVFENKAYPASATASEPSTVLAFNRDSFSCLLTEHPATAMAMIGILSSRLREAQNRLHDLSGERVEQRLARTLQRLTAKLGTELPFTRRDLADMSGTTIETAVRVLSRFSEMGIITSSRGKVTIKDQARLNAISDDLLQAQ
jgi:CRP/FNR family transcriptional regulator, nitrogen oxide reductase regulator